MCTWADADVAFVPFLIIYAEKLFLIDSQGRAVSGGRLVGPAAAAAAPQPQLADDDSEEWTELCDPDRMDQLLDGTTRLLELSTQSLELIDKNQELIMQLYEQASATASLLCLSAREIVPHSAVSPCASGSAEVEVHLTRSTLQLMLHTRVHHADRASSDMPPAAARLSHASLQ